MPEAEQQLAVPLKVVVELTREEASELERRCERAGFVMRRQAIDPNAKRIFDKILRAVRFAKAARLLGEDVRTN